MMACLTNRAINASLSSFILLSVVVFKLFSKTYRKRKYKLNVDSRRTSVLEVGSAGKAYLYIRMIPAARW